MDTGNKKYKQSAVAIICFVAAAGMLIYAIVTAVSTVQQINEYYESYGMSASAGEYFTYVLQGILDPLIHTFTFFVAGVILNAVRKLDPNNYVAIQEELAEIEVYVEEEPESTEDDAEAEAAAEEEPEPAEDDAEAEAAAEEEPEPAEDDAEAEEEPEPAEDDAEDAESEEQE